LKAELQMKKASPLKYRAYRLLLFLLGGDSRKARSALRRLGRVRSVLTGGLQGSGAAEQHSVQAGSK
jgi:hypothetical protein